MRIKFKMSIVFSENFVGNIAVLISLRMWWRNFNLFRNNIKLI